MNMFTSHIIPAYRALATEPSVTRSESGKSFKVERWENYHGVDPDPDLPIKEGWYVSYWDSGLSKRSIYRRVYEGPFEDKETAEITAQEIADDWDDGLMEKPRWTPPSDEGCICSVRWIRLSLDTRKRRSSNRAFGRNVEAAEEYVYDNFKPIADGLYIDQEGNVWERGMIDRTAKEECKCDRCEEIRAYEQKVLEERSRQYDQFNYEI